MKLLQLLTIVGLLGAVYASYRTCRHPVPKNNFNLRRFAGSYILAANDGLDPLDAKYHEFRCNILYIHNDIGNHKRNKWRADFSYGVNGVSDFEGTYYVPDPSVGFIKLFYAAGNFTYDFTVLGTDYENWLVAYACAEVTPTYTSEWVLFYVNNLSRYDEVVQYSSVKRLVSQISDKTVTELRKTPTTNCPADYNGPITNYQ